MKIQMAVATKGVRGFKNECGVKVNVVLTRQTKFGTWGFMLV
jgi:hypothetical protein